MKGRLIGALWIIAALAIGYFAWGGALFSALLFFCLLMALGEIIAITDYNPWRMRPYMGKLKQIHLLQTIVLCVAMINVWFFSRDELTLVIIVCVLSDVGAFTVGKTIGKHKVRFLRQVSPNKTWEGYVGGIVFALFAIPLAPALFGIDLTPVAITFILCGGLVAELGDLLGSACKRRLGIKDSNEELMYYPFFRILEYPVKGHGGYLDRVDSLALGLVVFAIIKYVASLF